MKDAEFFIPREPVSYDKESQWPIIQAEFYTNAFAAPLVHFAVRSPALCYWVAVDELSIPTNNACLKITYEKKGQTNCEGVSQYILSKTSEKELKEWFEAVKPKAGAKDE